MKNTLEGISNSINEAEEHTHELEDRMVEISAAEQTMKGNEDRLRDLWVNNNKIHQHIHILGVSRRIEKGSEKIFEDTVAENFPNMRRETVTKVQDV